MMNTRDTFKTEPGVWREIQYNTNVIENALLAKLRSATGPWFRSIVCRAVPGGVF